MTDSVPFYPHLSKNAFPSFRNQRNNLALVDDSRGDDDHDEVYGDSDNEGEDEDHGADGRFCDRIDASSVSSMCCANARGNNFNFNFNFDNDDGVPCDGSVLD